MIPKIDEYYFVDYRDQLEPEGAYMGIAKCVRIFQEDAYGKRLKEPLYEFMHPDKEGKMVLSLFVNKEILLPAVKP